MLKPGKLIRFGRDFLLVLSIAIGLIAAVEGMVRLAFNERTRTDYKNDIPTARKDPILGHINNPGTEASIVGPEFKVDYKITEQGFRNRAVFEPKPDEKTMRVLLLGDSFTFGHGSQYQDIWPTLMVEAFEAEGRKVEIINAGVPGFSTTQEVLYLERLHQQYDPDIVVFGFLAHDIITNVALDQADEVLEVSDAAAKSIGDDKKSSLHSVALLQRLLMTNDWLYSQLYMMTGRRGYFAAEPSAAFEDKIRITKELFRRADDYCEKQGSEFMALSMPQLIQVLALANGYTFDGVDMNHIDQTLSAFAKEEAFDWTPTLPQLAADYAERGEDLYFRKDGHLNEAGNRLVATIAYEALSAVIDRLAERDEKEDAAV